MGCAANVRLMFVLCVAACAACATPSAPDFSGRWKPVNYFPASVQEIPLRQAYVFYPSPTDRTLKLMLERWSLDSSMTLRYLHPSDFTLHHGVAGLRTGNIVQAAVALNQAYLVHGVEIAVEGSQIVVRQVGADVPLASTPSGLGTPSVP